MKAAPPPARLQDAAWLLPVAGLVLLMPPVVTLFTGEAHVFGIPRIVVYVFGVWLGLIGCAGLLARRLRPPG